MEFVNKYFDKIIFIHCKHRLDRLENINKFLDKTKITNYVILDATYIPKNGARGCSHSHYRAMKMSINNNWNKVMIIEDDFQFNDNVEDIDKYFKDSINSLDDNWDVIMPMWFINRIKQRSKYFNKYFRKPINPKYGAYSTLCYAVNNSIKKKLMKLFKKSYNSLEVFNDINNKNYLPCDKVWYTIQTKCKWFLFTPKLGYTIDTESDVQKRK